MEKMTLVACKNCGKEFERRTAEVKRNIKRGREIFCSRKCHGKYFTERVGNNLGDYLCQIGPNFYRKSDEYSVFGRYLLAIRTRCKQKGWVCEITKYDLKEIWDKQKGLCPYTGWQLIHPGSKKIPQNASVDRIDSSKGYAKENIEFVALIAQYAKNDWDSSVVKEFAEAVLNKGT